MSARKVLLLGRTGFVGRNLFEHLSQDCKLSIDAPSHSELDALSEADVFARLTSGRYDVVLNCLDWHALANAEYAEKRLRMYHNFAHHADLFGKMIYFGSGAEYGRQLPLVNVSESDFGRVIPADSYGFALFQMSLHALQSDNIYNYRLFGIFGPYERWQTRFISNCVCKALFGYPLTIRQDRRMDYLMTDDLCKFVDKAICSQLQHHAYNATSGKTYLLSDLANIVRHQSCRELPLFVAKDGLADEYTANNELLISEMDGHSVEPIEPMERSISKLFAYYQHIIDHIEPEKLLYND
jgi:GDP-L-fucose synthase